MCHTKFSLEGLKRLQRAGGIMYVQLPKGVSTVSQLRECCNETVPDELVTAWFNCVTAKLELEAAMSKFGLGE